MAWNRGLDLPLRIGCDGKLSGGFPSRQGLSRAIGRGLRVRSLSTPPSLVDVGGFAWVLIWVLVLPSLVSLRPNVP